MMNKVYPILAGLFLLLPICLSGQGVFHNFGNLQFHENSSVGFHSDLINDGIFDKNKGTVGFYRQESLTLSGAYGPRFYDIELAVENDLLLESSLQVTNSLNFIFGNLRSVRSNKFIYAQFMNEATYNGAANSSKIDGYAAVEGQDEFLFPVGYNHKLRSLGLRFIDGNFLAKCEYFFENPNNPDSFYEFFDILKKDLKVGTINTREFWNLSTSGIIQITLSWDNESILSSFVSKPERVVVVGWSKSSKKWENLGNSRSEGDLNSGWVSSNTFNANDYEIFTTGSSFDIHEEMAGNYVMSPNGDGNNDVLRIDITQKSPNNNLMIFDRTGLKVYEKINYQNEFTGIPNRPAITTADGHLPAGIYFYLLELKDLNLKHQGFFYISQN